MERFLSSSDDNIISGSRHNITVQAAKSVFSSSLAPLVIGMDLSVQLENVLSSSYDVCFTSMPSVIHADIPSCVSQEDKLPPLSLPFLSKNEVFGPFTRAERAHSDASGSEDSSSSSLLLSPIESVIDESKSPRELAVLLKKVHAALRSREAGRLYGA